MSRPTRRQAALAAVSAAGIAGVIVAIVVLAAHAPNRAPKGPSLQEQVTELTKQVDTLTLNARWHESRLQDLEADRYADEQALDRVYKACLPIDTGGGVVQCAQPSVDDLALRACLRNPGPYQGRTPEDTSRLLRQCLDDWRDMRNLNP